MFHIAICDDDKNFVLYIEEIIKHCDINPNEIEFHEFLSGEDFIKEINDIQGCDLLILDMQMNGLDGHATAKQFRQIYPDSILVFCSGVMNPTDESFKTTPYRYLKKSYSDVKMLCEMQAIIKKMVHMKPIYYVMGKNHYNVVKLRPGDILYIENYKRGSIINVCDEAKDYSFESRITTKLKLADLYEHLQNYGFEYAHNSYIVNLNYVIKLRTDGVLKLSNGCELNVARSKLQKFREALSDFLGSKYL